MIAFETYILSGAPRVVHTPVHLPVKLIIKPCLPVKNASYKITIDTNKPPVNLNDLFPGMLLSLIIPSYHDEICLYTFMKF